MTDRDREILALPWWQNTIKKIGDGPLVVSSKITSDGKHYKKCIGPNRVSIGQARFLIEMGFLTLQSESNGVAVYVRAGTGEPKAAWNGGIL